MYNNNVLERFPCSAAVRLRCIPAVQSDVYWSVELSVDLRIVNVSLTVQDVDLFRHRESVAVAEYPQVGLGCAEPVAHLTVENEATVVVGLRGSEL